jgi:antitoxin Phd
MKCRKTARWESLFSLRKTVGGRFVVIDIEDYERDKAEKKLLEKLQEAEATVEDGKGWLSLDELKIMVGE